MAATFPFVLHSITSSKTKLFHPKWSSNLGRSSSKILSMNHSGNEHLTSSSPESVPHTDNHEVTPRRTVNFPPSVGDDSFISSSSSGLEPNTATKMEIEDLRKQVKGILSSAVTDPSEQLVYIDKIQRLGIAYHFSDEIDKALQLLYDNTYHEEGDLNIVSLRFRLLRQAGKFVSPDVFNKFKDEKGEFIASLRHDLPGLLSLYETAHLGRTGETILDEAIAFTAHHLEDLARKLNLENTSEVRRALHLPLRKRIPRVEATYYMSVYEDVEESYSDVLLQLAILDYNHLQLLHQTELKQLIRWWKKSNIMSSQSFQARDRLVEGYAIFLSVIPETKYSIGRIFNAKLYAIFTVIDDIFDVYGTIEELRQITDSISRWDVKGTDELPGFAKAIVEELFNIFSEMEEDMAMRGLHYGVPYLKGETQHYIGCALKESELFHRKSVPTLEEWLQISITTKGGKFMIIGLLLAHWDLLTKEAMNWSISETAGNYSCARGCRILGDIHTYKTEQERKYGLFGCLLYERAWCSRA